MSTVSTVHSAVIPPSMMVSFHQVTCLDNFSSLFHIFHIIFNHFCDKRKEKAPHIFLVSWFHFTFPSVTSIPVSAYLNFLPFLFVAYGEEWGERLLLAYLCQFLFDVLLSTFLIPTAGNLFLSFCPFLFCFNFLDMWSSSRLLLVGRLFRKISLHCSSPLSSQIVSILL